VDEGAVEWREVLPMTPLTSHQRQASRTVVGRNFSVVIKPAFLVLLKIYPHKHFASRAKPCGRTALRGNLFSMNFCIRKNNPKHG
jgi:hypothetical protein